MIKIWDSEGRPSWHPHFTPPWFNREKGKWYTNSADGVIECDPPKGWNEKGERNNVLPK